MGHDATKFLWGNIQSSEKELTQEDADPAVFVAGLAVRKSSTGAIGVTSATGGLIGVSCGRSLSDIKRLSVARAGLRVPLKLKDEGVIASLTVNGDMIFKALSKGAYGNDISIELLDTGSAGDEEVTVTGNKISVSMEDGVSTANQIKAAVDASVAAMLLIQPVEIVSGQGGEAQAALAEDNLENGVDSGFYAVPGAIVYTDNTTGEGASSGTTTGAVYVSGSLSGIDPITGVETAGALIDMPGGL